VGRALDLDVAAGAERDDLALGELEDELLDEGGDAVVGLDGAGPLADEKTSAWTSISMSDLTLTWHDRRQPSRASPLEM
jgi:hypothetical protein